MFCKASSDREQEYKDTNLQKYTHHCQAIRMLHSFPKTPVLGVPVNQMKLEAREMYKGSNLLKEPSQTEEIGRSYIKH